MSHSHLTTIHALNGKALRSGGTLIDIGAGDGSWAAAVLGVIPNMTIHCCEADEEQYQLLIARLATPIADGRVIAHQTAIGAGNAWGSVAKFAAQMAIGRISLLRLGDGISTSTATLGCEDLIRHGHIEFILAPATAEQEKQLCDVLLPNRYEIFRHPAMGDQVLCCSDRFRSTIKGEAPAMPDVLELCREFGIKPSGVIHIGAHEGHEAAKYVGAGIKKTLMVEANPAVFARLQKNVVGLPGVITVNCAASDHDGTIELNVTNADQSSSILPLARHAEIYPSVQQTSTVVVDTRTVDRIILQANENPEDYNLLNLDIQGAELLALKGAVKVLPRVQAILTEVNYEELYTGCAMIEQVDAFLESQGFDRVATTTPYHPSWGDAFYVRRRPAPASRQDQIDFLYDARNKLVHGWLSLPADSLRQAWEGATGRAHHHLVENGVRNLPLDSGDDLRVCRLLEDNLKVAAKDRRLNLLLASMLYRPPEAQDRAKMPGWLKKSLALNAA